jgi:hypothetical protein
MPYPELPESALPKSAQIIELAEVRVQVVGLRQLRVNPSLVSFLKTAAKAA